MNVREKKTTLASLLVKKRRLLKMEQRNHVESNSSSNLQNSHADSAYELNNDKSMLLNSENSCSSSVNELEVNNCSNNKSTGINF